MSFESSATPMRHGRQGRLFAAHDPLDGAKVGYLIGAERLPPAEELAALVRDLPSRRVIARIEAPDALLASNSPWHVDSVWVAREPEERAGVAPDELVVELVPTSSDDDVLLMLAKAGVAGAREHISFDEAALRVRQLVTDGVLAGACSIVARFQGTTIAHSTFRVDAPDPTTGEPFTELVDTYVADGWTGRHLGSLLTDYVLAAAAQHRQRVLGHVVWEGGAGASVLQKLERNGWVRVFVLYAAEVPRAVRE